MKRMLHISALASCMAFAAPADAAGRDASASFSTEVRIDVGDDGRVVDVGFDRPLTPVLESAVRSHVAAWRFAAPMRDGRAVSGTTYAYLTGCAVASPQGLALSFAPASNGPGHGAQGIVGTHLLPIREMEPGKFTVNVEYRVQPDGSVLVDEVRSDGRRSRAMRNFEKSIETWLAGRRFLPEKVGGEAVATRMVLPITYEISRVERGAPLPRSEVVEATCRTAAEGAGSKSERPVAVDSPFKLVPAG